MHSTCSSTHSTAASFSVIPSSALAYSLPFSLHHLTTFIAAPFHPRVLDPRIIYPMPFPPCVYHFCLHLLYFSLWAVLQLESQCVNSLHVLSWNSFFISTRPLLDSPSFFLGTGIEDVSLFRVAYNYCTHIATGWATCIVIIMSGTAAYDSYKYDMT